MVFSILGLHPSASTVEHFRNNVYRPRLCLLLLILVLSPYHARQLSGASSHADSAAKADPSGAGGSGLADWTVSLIDGLVVAAPVAPAASSLSHRTPPSTPSQQQSQQQHLSKGLSWTPKDQSSSPSSAAPVLGPSSQPTSASALGVRPPSSTSQDSQDSQPAPGSLFRLPKPSWAMLIDGHVLPAVFPLHLLWALRFLGMAVEDSIVKTSLIGAKSRFHALTLPLVQLIVLAALALVVGTPPFLNSVARWCARTQLAISLEGADTVTATSATNSQGGETLLPLKLLVVLEMTTVLFSLLSALFKVDDPALAFLPKSVKLPSPSHSPGILELLPLPPGLKETLMVSNQPIRRSAGRRARGRRPLIAQALDAGRPPRSVSPSPGISAAAAATEAAAVDSRVEMTSASSTAVQRTPAAAAAAAAAVAATDDAPRQQTFRIVGTDGREVLRSTSVTQPIAPLRLTAADVPSPSPSHSRTDATAIATSTTPARRIKAPRLTDQHVHISSRWLLETLVSLYDKLVGTLLYAIVTLRLPTLSPTSLPPVLSLLSLRSELAKLTGLWAKARGSVECLEFVRRRWGVEVERGADPYDETRLDGTAPKGRKASRRSYTWMSHEDVSCAICFELTREGGTSSAVAGGAEVEADGAESHKWRFCRLDCGHEMHDTCLVAWLTNQAFCPTCHCVLSFSPPAPPSQAASVPSTAVATPAVAATDGGTAD